MFPPHKRALQSPGQYGNRVHGGLQQWAGRQTLKTGNPTDPVQKCVQRATRVLPTVALEFRDFSWLTTTNRVNWRKSPQHWIPLHLHMRTCIAWETHRCMKHSCLWERTLACPQMDHQILWAKYIKMLLYQWLESELAVLCYFKSSKSFYQRLEIPSAPFPMPSSPSRWLASKPEANVSWCSWLRSTPRLPPEPNGYSFRCLTSVEHNWGLERDRNQYRSFHQSRWGISRPKEKHRQLNRRIMTLNNARGLWSWKAASGLDNLQLAWKKSRQWKHALVASSPSTSAGAEAGLSASAVALWGSTARQQAGHHPGPRCHAERCAAISVFQTSVTAGWRISALELEREQPQQQQIPGKAGGVGEMQRQGAEPFNCEPGSSQCERRGRRHGKRFGSYHRQRRPQKPLIMRYTGSCVTANKCSVLRNLNPLWPGNAARSIYFWWVEAGSGQALEEQARF